jgi:hypothetical protein
LVIDAIEQTLRQFALISNETIKTEENNELRQMD